MTNGSTAMIAVNINYLGGPTPAGYADKIYDGQDHSNEVEYRFMRSILGISPEQLDREVIKRYCRISTPDFYLCVFPFTPKIAERLLGPLKSAKRCYALGEFLATIELCCHVGEMLATLLWEMAPVSTATSSGNERLDKLLERDFEELGQDSRIKVLRILSRLDETDAQGFHQLRIIRRKHYHLWSADSVGTVEQDAFVAFQLLVGLVRNVLKINIQDGMVSVNPAMLDYLRRKGAIS